METAHTIMQNIVMVPGYENLCVAAMHIPNSIRNSVFSGACTLLQKHHLSNYSKTTYDLPSTQFGAKVSFGYIHTQRDIQGIFKAAKEGIFLLYHYGNSCNVYPSRNLNVFVSFDVNKLRNNPSNDKNIPKHCAEIMIL